MKVFDAFRIGSLSTRRFPAWLHAFNILCGVAALAILGFGVYLLATRDQRSLGGVVSGARGARIVDRDVLVAKLEDPKQAEKLGKMLRVADEEDRVIVLEAAREEVLPGVLLVARDNVEGRGPASFLARKIVKEGMAVKRLDDRVSYAIVQVVLGDGRIRRKAVERLIASDDPRALAALSLARELPPGEEAPAELAKRAVGDRAAPPLTWFGDWLLEMAIEPEDEEERARAIVGLGMIQMKKAEGPLRSWLGASDPIVRERAKWALARLAR